MIVADSKVTHLGQEGRHEALGAETTSASCKQGVMQPLHLPQQHPWGSLPGGKRQQNAETAAFPAEKRHFSVLLSSIGPRWNCSERSLSIWRSSGTCQWKQRSHVSKTGIPTLQFSRVYDSYKTGKNYCEWPVIIYTGCAKWAVFFIPVQTPDDSLLLHCEVKYCSIQRIVVS